MDSPIIEEKLKVFISSAMGAEKDSDTNDNFKWLDFRRQVKEELNSCPYVRAFIIEDHTSEMKSNDFMIYNVDTSDIVVLLIRNEFRQGTSVEYARCCQTNKPLLVFFFGDEYAKDEVKALQDDFIKSDYCTFRYMNDFINAEKTIANFETCYKTIYKYIGVPYPVTPTETKEQPPLIHIGEQVIKWAINGERFLSPDVKSNLVSSVSTIYLNTNWYSKRLDAIDYYIQGNMIQAYLSEKEALKLAEESNIPSWITNNILIDLRNLQLLCPKDQIKSEIQNIKKDWTTLILLSMCLY